MKRIGLLLIAIVLLAGIFYQMSINRQDTPDDEQIRMVLDNAQKAVERNDARGAMEAVSRNYKDGAGITYPILRLRAADALSSGVQPDVVLSNPSVKVQGSDASVSLNVHITDRRENNQVLVEHAFTVHLKKEKVRKHFIFTVRQWRITSIEGLGGVIESY